MKLNLFFIMMDMLILMAYPIVFVHGILFRLVNPKAVAAQPLRLAAAPAAHGRA